MGFWIYMLIMDLLIPAAMIGFGRLFLKRSPKNINMLFGYRTSMSMKNKDTWDFAHKHIGKSWSIAGAALLPATLIPMLFVIGREPSLISKMGGVICLIQIVVMLCLIIPTEIALKKNFDQFGNRR